MTGYIGAVDQGTTSTRFILFDHDGKIAGFDQKEHRQIFARPGWVEHDPSEIWDNTREVIRNTLEKTGIPGSRILAQGVTNQRETCDQCQPHPAHGYSFACLGPRNSVRPGHPGIRPSQNHSFIRPKNVGEYRS